MFTVLPEELILFEPFIINDASRGEQSQIYSPLGNSMQKPKGWGRPDSHGEFSWLI